jgi:formylglycine-generating enzyme required for sulfatase activity
MKQNYRISLCAMLLVGAVSMMTARAQGSGKPTLVVFVVGMDNTLGDALATQIGDDLNRNSRYTVLSSAADPVKTKLTELRTQGARNIDRNALAEWGHANGVSTICLVTDDIKGSDNMFLAQLIDTKDSKLSGKGRYIRTGIVEGELPRVSLALTKQLEGPERKRSAPAPARSYPSELDIEMVRVEGGTFTMGCIPEHATFCSDDEIPTHSVTVSNFYIGKYEVTQAQWKVVMAGHPLENVCHWQGANCGDVPCDDQRPMESVSWFDVDTAFLPRLNALTGRMTTTTKYRLATEAEWEYAARGCKGNGDKSTAACEDFLYSGSNDINEVGWSIENASGMPRLVGQKKSNKLGIYDMSGNVWEWCNDWYGIYSSAAVTDPKGPETGSIRVMRGGDCGATANWHRPTIRHRWISPTEHSSSIGFRVVLPAQ